MCGVVITVAARSDHAGEKGDQGGAREGREPVARRKAANVGDIIVMEESIGEWSVGGGEIAWIGLPLSCQLLLRASYLCAGERRSGHEVYR